jgi:hypothetical protein
MMEMEAFVIIHDHWAKLGYPFAELVPSYATALGASADRPGALAELAGIIQNNGIRLPLVRYESLLFAEGTPYCTEMKKPEPDEKQRVLSEEVVRYVKKCMYDVVENGTGQRIRNAFSVNGQSMLVGGKTGTGDHRLKWLSKDGRTINERVMNRSATFVFVLGDRYFGAITAFVPGESAKNYAFTSAFPVQILKSMAPMLKTVLAEASVPADFATGIEAGASSERMFAGQVDAIPDSAVTEFPDEGRPQIIQDDVETESDDTL